MALVPKITACVDCKHRRIIVTDGTGTYDASSNPGGFGSPNPTTGSLTSAYVIIENETIGQVVFDVLSTFSTLDEGLNIWAQHETEPSLDLGDGIQLPDGIVRITLQLAGSVSGVPYMAEGVFETLMTCRVECCADKLQARSNCGCHGGNAAGQDAGRLMNGIKYAWGCGKRQQALDNLSELQKICSSECKGCGC